MRVTHSTLRPVVVLAVTVAAAVVHGQSSPPCAGCLISRYWAIPSDDWEKPGEASFPEDPILAMRPELYDMGIAFSGGGTRSAAATLGQLRGLQHLGWLQHVRYVSAISGGAWGAIPFTFAKQSIDDLLGQYVSPGDLTEDMVRHSAIGSLGVAIAQSSLASGALREGAAEFLSIRNRDQSIPNPLLSQIVSLTNRFRREGQRDDKTYARLLGRVFIDGLIEPNAADQYFSWNGKTVEEMAALNPGRLGNFVQAHAGRPFLIASGSMVSARLDYVNPLLVPIEYTPMYVGARQQFGRFGGGYVWPWAYDPEAIGQATADARDPQQGTLEVKVKPGRQFTLADVAASTGAAPEVPILNGLGIDGPLKAKIQLAAAFFPHFNHYAFATMQPPMLTVQIAHADGGGIDNLGIMPLLARHVHNIIVFNNTVTPLVEQNSEMEALFLDNATATVTTDSRGNKVFDSDKWDTVKTALVTARESRRPQVYCDKDWQVLKNERFNIRAYGGLSICFVYNASADQWEGALQMPVRKLLKDRHSANFPYFRTFGQNVPHLIQLTPPQVNLLSNLTAWVVANDETAKTIRQNMTAKLP